MRFPTRTLLAALSVATSASAADGNWAVFSLDACDPASLSDATRNFRSELAKRKELQVLTDEATLRPLGGASLGTLADAAEVLRKAQGQFLASDFSHAEQASHRALDIGESLTPSPERWEVLREAWTLIALIEDRTGRSQAAMARMRHIVSVDPSFQAAPETCPPAFIERVEAMKTELKTGPHAKLSVTTLPRGLPVFVGGIAAGASPVYLDLPLGDYEVAVRWGSRRGLPRQVHLEADVNVLMDASVEGAVYADAGPCIETDGTAEQRIGLLAQYGQELKVTTVAGLRVEEHAGAQRLVAIVVDVAKGRAMREAAIAWGSAPAADLTGRLVAFAAGDPAGQGVEALLEKPSEAPPPPVETHLSAPLGPMLHVHELSPGELTLRYASYAGAVLATAQLGVGAFCWVEADRNGSFVEALIDVNNGAFLPGTESQYGAYVVQENRYRSWAVGLFVGTGVVAVVSFILYVKSGAWVGKPSLISGDPRRSPGLTFDF